jgi:hypothetical protein
MTGKENSMHSSGYGRKIFLAAAAGLVAAVCGPGTAFGAVASDLEGIIVYPNPLNARAGQTAFTFNNLTENARIRIYKMNGELVAEKEIADSDGKAVWDATNKDGAAAAGGLYVYLVTNDGGQKKTGKLAIRR